MEFPSSYQTLTEEVIEARTLDILSQQPEGHVFTPTIQQLYSNLALPSSQPSIRLLHLHLAQDGEDSPLVGELSVVNIQDHPKFSTLSYTWGSTTSPNLKLTITPDNAEFDITPNCYKALKQIRKLFGAVTIWVDSICINQANEDEKATQIALMQDIYALGHICYVWLGEGDETSKSAMEHLKFRARSRGRLPITYLMANDLHERDIEWRKFKRNWWDDMIYRLKSKRIKYFSRLKSLSSQEDFSRICGLFQSSWSNRMWTFQEIILSRHPVLICGDKTLEWEDLIGALWLSGGYNIGEAFNNWHSMMQIWLEFPRNIDESRRRQASVRDLLEAEFGFFSSLMLRLALLQLTQALVGVILPLVTGIVVGSLVTTALDTTGPKKGIWMAVVVIFLIFIITYSISVSWRYFGFIFFGVGGTCWNGWPRSTPAGGDSPTNLLYGIWFALRKRACSEPCDKSFGLSGILKQSGANLSTLAHSQSLREIYESLMGSLVGWNYEAVTLIADAGIQNLEQTGWPSWLPNWTLPEENTWLLKQVRSENGYYTRGQRQRITSPIDIISHNSMRLRGYSKGTIASDYRFVTITNDATHAQKLENLLKIKRWILYNIGTSNINVAKVVLTPFYYSQGVKPTYGSLMRYIRTSLFCILEGLVRDTRPTQDAPSTIRKRGRKTQEWEAPYDLEDHEQELTAFLALFAIIIRRYQSDNVFLRKVQNKPAAYKYFVRIVNKMVTEKRCLFKLSSGLLGTGRSEVSVGDEVFLFPGVCAPMAVRQGGKEGRIVIGPVCAPSVMHGKNMHRQEQTEVILI